MRVDIWSVVQRTQTCNRRSLYFSTIDDQQKSFKSEYVSNTENSSNVRGRGKNVHCILLINEQRRHVLLSTSVSWEKWLKNRVPFAKVKCTMFWVDTRECNAHRLRPFMDNM